MPSLPNSFARLFTRPTTPARTAFESTRSGTGCLVEMEVKVMIRPQRLRCMCGMTSRAKYTVLMKFASIALRHSSMRRRQKSLGRRSTGIGDADIHAAEFVGHGLDEVMHRSGIGHIEGLRKNLRAGLLADFLRRRFEFFASAGAHRDPASFSSKSGGSFPPDSLTGSSYNRDPTS